MVWGVKCSLYIRSAGCYLLNIWIERRAVAVIRHTVIIRILDAFAIDKEELVAYREERFQHHRIVFSCGSHSHLYTHE